MQWVDTNEIQKVITATPLVVPGGGTVLIDSDAGPLLAIAPREGFEDLVLGMVLIEQRAGPTVPWPFIAIPTGPGGRVSPRSCSIFWPIAPAART